MSDVAGADAPAGGGIVPANVQTDTGPISLRQAAASFAARREKGEAAAEPEAKPGDKPTEQPRVNGRFASAAAPQESTPDTGSDAGPDEVPGETVGDDPAGELPPIDPPRSWSKEDKELFNTLPRETQERVYERERARESDFLQRQNKATEQTKALEAKEQAAEQARQQFEAAAPNVMQFLQEQLLSSFPELASQEAMNKLANDDPFRAIAAREAEREFVQKAQDIESKIRQAQQEKVRTFEAWSKEQDDKFSGQFKEFNDPEAGPKARQAVQSYLTKEVGVPEDTLPKLWNNPLFRDAMFQRVIYDASRFHAAQQKAKAAVPVKVPPVQRPGSPPAKGEQGQADIKALETKLSKATTTRDQIAAAAALRAAKRVAAH